MESNSIIAMMFERQTNRHLVHELTHMSAVALLGPRQVGKTTLALEVARGRPSLYLDLESARDRSKLAEPELYLAEHHVERGFHVACDDMQPQRRLVTYPGQERFPMGNDIEATPLTTLCNELTAMAAPH
jgi:AAA domain